MDKQKISLQTLFRNQKIDRRTHRQRMKHTNKQTNKQKFSDGSLDFHKKFCHLSFFSIKVTIMNIYNADIFGRARKKYYYLL